MTAPNAGLDTLFSLTLRNTRKVIADNFTGHNEVLSSIKSAGGVEEKSGGYEIQEPLMYASNTTIKSFSGAEPFDMAPQDPVTSATYSWKQIGGTTQIDGMTAFQNSGKERIISVLEAYMKQLKLSFDETVDEQLVGDGTGTNNKDIGGLALLVEEGAAWSTVGGIDSNAYSWWRNQSTDFDTVYTGGFTATDSGQLDANGTNAFRKMYYNCTRGTQTPSLILTTQTVCENLEAVTETHYRTQSLSQAELGFKGTAFKGIPVVYSANVPVGTAWFLNTQFLRFVIGKGHNMKMSGFEAPIDQDAKVAKIHLYANMTCNRRDAQGVIYDIN